MSSNTILKIHLSLIFGLMLLITGCATSQLHVMARKGDVKAVSALLDNGADVNAKDPGFSCPGWTPLHWAAENNRADVALLLIERGADLNAKGHLNFRTWTPLQLAEKQRNTMVVRMLREAEEKEYKNLYAKESDQDSEKIPRRETSKPAIVKSDVDELPVMQVKPNKNAYAIVIGVEKYRQQLPKADYADNDARIMAEYLTKVMGYPEENVVILTNDRAALGDFVKYFEKWLPNNVEQNGTVFVYYSGHGAPNPNTGDAYLVPYDGDPSFIEQTGYSLKRLYANLNKLPAKEIIVVLDSCFSGAGGRSVLAKGARPLVMNIDKQVFHSDRIAILSAAAENQISSTHEEKGHGLFTYFFLKGIKDGNSELGTLYNYLKPQVERIARKTYNNEQTPGLIAPAGLLNLRLYDR